jgi:membrane fusion protein, heavy metal efflux system
MNQENDNQTEETFENKETGDGKKSRTWLVAASVVSVLLFGLITVFVWQRTKGPAELTTAEAEKNEAGTVKFLMEQQWLVKMKLAQAEEQTVSRQITAVGRVIPAANSQAVVSTPVAGILSDRQLPRIGQFISAGSPIAIVRQTATSAEQAQTRAAIAQAEAQKVQLQSQNAQISVENARLESEKRAAAGEVDASKIRLDTARREADRMQRLFDGKAASEKQLQAARSEAASAQSNYDSALRRRDALLAARPVIPVNVGSISVGGVNNNLTISAPFGGYVTKVNKSIGEQVSPGDAIVEISNLDTVYVEAPIFERDLNLLGGGRTATFTTSAYPQDFKGSIVDIGASIDEQTRAANVVFVVENAGRALRLGMQANVKLDAEQSVTAKMVPKEAVIESEGKQYVYVLLSGEEFQRREVTIGDEYGEKVAILTGVEKGERVVTQGAYQLRLQELRPADTGVHSHET